jgi:WD40 repeat protein
VGGGVLVGSKHVVTCAHVVRRALSCPHRAGELDVPSGSVVRLDFPFVHEQCRAHVLEEGWRDIADDQSGDIAVLELDEPLPAGASSPPLLCPPRLEGRDVLAYGYLEHRAWHPAMSSNQIGGLAGPEWLQLSHVTGLRADGRDGGPLQIQPGFSGNAVWDDEAGAVLGIVVVAEPQGSAAGTAFMIPVSVLCDAWGPLEDWTGWRSRFARRQPGTTAPAAPRRDDGVAVADRFVGREEALRRLVRLTGSAPSQKAACVVIGRPGSGKSAVLGELVERADREHVLPAGECPPRPELRPAPGAVTLAISVAQEATREAFETPPRERTAVLAGSQGVDLLPPPAQRPLRAALAAIAKWLDVEPGPASDIVDALAKRASLSKCAPLLVVDELDGDIPGHAAVVERLLVPLVSENAARLVVGVRTSDDSRLRDMFSSHAEIVDLDGDCEDTESMVCYAQRILTAADGAQAYREIDMGADLARDVAERVAAAAGTSFLVARLSALWMKDHPPEDGGEEASYPDSVTAAMNRYVSGIAEAGGVSEAQIRDLMSALAYARGSGLASEGPVWPLVAGALGGREYRQEQVADLLTSAASYLTRRVDVHGKHHAQLFHPALADSLRASRDAAADEQRICKRLIESCSRDDARPADPYVELHLADHVAAADQWPSLAAELHVLDRLDPESLLRQGLRLGMIDGSLPPEIVGVLRSEHLAVNSGPGDRTGLRQLGMARTYPELSFESRHSMGSWTLRSAVLARHPMHLTLTAGAPVVAVVSFGEPAHGTLIAAACTDGRVRLWDLSTGKVKGPLGAAVSDDELHALAVFETRAGPRLITGGASAKACIWDPIEETREWEQDCEYRDGIDAVAAFAIGEVIYAAIAGGAEIGLWRVEPGHATARVGSLQPSARVRALASHCAADGTVYVAAGGNDARIQVWELAGAAVPLGGGEHVESNATLPGLGDWARAICLLEREGSLVVVATGDDRRLLSWRYPEPSPQWEERTDHTGGVRALAVSRHEETLRLVTGGVDRVAQARRIDNGKPVGLPLTGHTGAISGIGAFALAGRPHLLTGAQDGSVRIWDEAAEVASFTYERHGAPVLAIAAHGAGLLVTGAADGALCVWERDTGRPRSDSLGARVGAIRALACIGEELILVAGDEGVVRFYESSSLAECGEPLRGHGGPIRTIALCRLNGDQVVVTGSDDGSTRVWGALSRKELRGCRAELDGPARAIALVGRGTGSVDRVAVAGPGRDVELALLSGRGADPPLRGHLDWPMAATAYLTNAGWQLVTAGDDATVRSWNPDTSRQFAVIGRHEGPVRCVASICTKDGVRIATGSDDETVCVWDPGGCSAPVHRLALGTRINALASFEDYLYIATDDGHLAVDLAAR